MPAHTRGLKEDSNDGERVEEEPSMDLWPMRGRMKGRGKKKERREDGGSEGETTTESVSGETESE